MTDLLPFEAWAHAKSTAPWLVAAARALRGWPAGREVSELQFDEACAEASEGQLG